MTWPEWSSLAAVCISFLTLIVPIVRSRQRAKVLEILSVPMLPEETWIYAVVSNKATTPLTIYGATLNGIRVYRHKHHFADRPNEEPQYSSEFPFVIPPQSSAGILMEFVNENEQPLDRSSKSTLILNGDRHPLKKKFVINHNAVGLEKSLREI